MQKAVRIFVAYATTFREFADRMGFPWTAFSELQTGVHAASQIGRLRYFARPNTNRWRSLTISTWSVFNPACFSCFLTSAGVKAASSEL